MGPNQPPQAFGAPPGPATYPPSTYPPPQVPPGGFDPQGPGYGRPDPQGAPGGFDQQGPGYGRQEPPGAFPQQGGPQGFQQQQGFPQQGAPQGFQQQGAPQGFQQQGGPQGGNTAWGGPPDSEQDRFGAFQPPPAETQAAKPEPKERNLRVFVLVVIAALLILVVPLGAVYAFTRGSDTFTPEVGSCVKQSGPTDAVKAECNEPNAFRVESKEDSGEKCADQTQPRIEIAGDGGRVQVLCLKPAASG
jgi:hypothetical protein